MVTSGYWGVQLQQQNINDSGQWVMMRMRAMENVSMTCDDVTTSSTDWLIESRLNVLYHLTRDTILII